MNKHSIKIYFGTTSRCSGTAERFRVVLDLGNISLLKLWTRSTKYTNCTTKTPTRFYFIGLDHPRLRRVSEDFVRSSLAVLE